MSYAPYGKFTVLKKHTERPSRAGAMARFRACSRPDSSIVLWHPGANTDTNILFRLRPSRRHLPSAPYLAHIARVGSDHSESTNTVRFEAVIKMVSPRRQATQ